VSALARTAPTRHKMDRLTAILRLEKLSDGAVGLVHEYATFCHLKKAGALRRQDMLDLGGSGRARS